MTRIAAEDKYKIVFENARRFLKEMTPKEINLDKYLEYKKDYVDLREVLERLIESLVNRGMMPKVIKFQERKSIFKEILYNFDAGEILSKYANEDCVMSEFKKRFEIKNTQSKRNSWKMLAKGIISGSRFMSSFNDKAAFDEFVKLFSKNQYTKEALPMLLAKEIDGFGFALACDFLKEIGCREYPKPDVHLIKIFSELGLSKKADYEVYKAIINMAEIVNQDAYTVDKYFWLISTGKFYPDKNNPKHEIRVGSHRDEFIKDTKNLLLKAGN